MTAWTSFDAFVVARGPALLTFAYLLSRDRHQAQDLVQEALSNTHRRWTVHNDLRLDVSTPASGRWDREELARFANGISYSGQMSRQEG